MITFQLEQSQVEVGGNIAGVATWAPEGTPRIKALILSIGWRTEGRGSTVNDVVGELRFPPGPDGFIDTVTLPFAFPIPREGPASYDGKLLRVIWEVTLRGDVPLAFDEKQAAQFWVSPARAER